MFGIGFPEMIVILLLIVLVVGPEQLPEVMRKGVAFFREARSHLYDIKAAVDEQAAAVREPLESIQESIRGDISEGAQGTDATDNNMADKKESKKQ